ncbi:uncharacterized protein BCR38DRAFT_444526 [Pseudomassariella vexata]|uniref:Uncharacterized protein n=1 Tax=Pseudomassariella vexata TaxID=1141098 RepID=A0A1Y2DMC6_9PEZI|nr:uncharacterized protein BCR38DRAFT_444526 [Pseudomassariella vexata]ORY60286.1 hypothetical protein BCR38DRAFT_444526 [Pseudomassariella vexata]
MTIWLLSDLYNPVEHLWSQQYLRCPIPLNDTLSPEHTSLIHAVDGKVTPGTRKMETPYVDKRPRSPSPSYSPSPPPPTRPRRRVKKAIGQVGRASEVETSQVLPAVEEIVDLVHQPRSERTSPTDAPPSKRPSRRRRRTQSSWAAAPTDDTVHAAEEIVDLVHQVQLEPTSAPNVESLERPRGRRRRTQGGQQQQLVQAAPTQTSPTTSPGGSSLTLKLDLDLEVEVSLKSTIKGDLLLTLFA